MSALLEVSGKLRETVRLAREARPDAVNLSETVDRRRAEIDRRLISRIPVVPDRRIDVAAIAKLFESSNRRTA